MDENKRGYVVIAILLLLLLFFLKMRRIDTRREAVLTLEGEAIYELPR